MGRPSGHTDAVAERIAIIRRMKADGASYAVIGKKFGVTRQAIHFLIRIRTTNAGKTCDKCGCQGEQLHRHHDDYLTDKFRFLCLRCHNIEHNGDPREPRKSGPRGPSPMKGVMGGRLEDRKPTKARIEHCRAILAAVQNQE